ncbi:apolipoprotein N-acyltransferase [Streptomyces sp. NPDC006971]|uniref:apolipoprotein N-acyltransferase n=1 Tax=Streptomyces sp. NPDC006971 TaxID=3154784 RepID=UPI0033DF6B9B
MRVPTGRHERYGQRGRHGPCRGYVPPERRERRKRREQQGPPERRGRCGRVLRSAPWRGCLALLAGALPALAFPTPSLWWFAYVALVPWLLLIRSAGTGRRAALDGWLGGTGFLLAVHHWLLPSLHVFLLILAALLGLLWAPWGLLVFRLLRGRMSAATAAAALVVVPCGWLLIETVRSWQGLGGPWGLLGASQWEVAPALRVASVGGVWLVSLLLVVVNTAVVLLFVAGGARKAGVVGVALCALSVGAAAGWAPQPRPSGVARIAVVQPGVLTSPHSIERRLAAGERLTGSLAGRDLDLVVWGESSVGVDPARHPDVTARIAALSRRVGADVLINADARQSDGSGRTGIFKSAMLVGPDGLTGDRYDKMRLVPFGEYVPARSLLGWATSVGRAAGEDRLRGARPVTMPLPDAVHGRGLRIGPLICFESAFPDMSRRLTRDGAQLLVVQSSTSTFQHSWAPEQHASLGALRAAENGRPVVHATLTGVSTVYGSRGERIGTPLGTDTSGAEVFDVPLASGTTLYVRWGDWPLVGATAVLVVYAASVGARAVRRRDPGAEGGVPGGPTPETDR